MGGIPYENGQPVNAAEAAFVVAAMLPGRKIKAPPLALCAGLHAAHPNLFNHQVNRCRGVAFDSGEAGFSHKRLEGENEKVTSGSITTTG